MHVRVTYVKVSFLHRAIITVVIVIVGSPPCVLAKRVSRFSKQGLGGVRTGALLAHEGGVALTACLHSILKTGFKQTKQENAYPPTVVPHKTILWPLHSNKVSSSMGTVKAVACKKGNGPQTAALAEPDSVFFLICRKCWAEA